jgi:Bacteriophage protein gp37
MGVKSNIAWTDHTWNIARGCTKVSEECKFCYMMRDGDRFKYDGNKVVKTKSVFKFPLKLKETKSEQHDGNALIFTSSLTDVFHEDIDSFRNEMWDIIRRCPHLIFQILTKRPERVNKCLPDDWTNGWDNVWLGTSVGLQKNMQKAWDLLKVPSKKYFLSIEPLLGEIDLHHAELLLSDWRNKSTIENYFDWIIVGGESGNETGVWRYRECKLEWIEKIVDQCTKEGVPVFVKQLGTHLSKQMNLKDRHGANINEFPEHLKVRQFPH